MVQSERRRGRTAPGLSTVRPRSQPASTRDPLALLVEGAVNRVLALDPEADRILAELDDARLRVTVEGPLPACLLFELNGASVRVSSDRERAADAEVCGEPQRLLAMLRSDGDLPSAHGVRVSGDAAKLASIVRAVRAIRPDWEEPIARGLGDSAAGPVVAGLRGLARFVHDAGRELAGGTAEFLREESELLIRPEDLSEMVSDVKRLGDDAARLEKRIAAIERRLDARA